MAESYYVRIRGQVGGPFGEDKLIVLVQRGQLSRSHEVSEDGQVWKPASDLPSLFGKRSKSVGVDKDQAAEAPEKADSVSTPAVSDSEPNAEQWYYAVGGQKTGPLSWNVLQHRVSVGAIPPDALVWTQRLVDWQPAGSVPGLVRGGEPPTQSKNSSITWSELLPVFRVWNDGGWTLTWVQCLAVALLFPLIALEYHGREGINLIWAAITFSLYFSLLWTAFFHWCIAPSRISAWRLLGTWLFTATLGVLGVLIFSVFSLSLFADSLVGDSSASLLKLVVGWTLGVGLVEEVGKMLAVLVLTRNIKASVSPRTCAFVGVVSGLAFGTIEAIAYTYSYVLVHQQAGGIENEAYGTLFFSLMLRWICLPLLHAVWTGIAGFFVGLSYRARTGNWGWVLRGLFIAAVLHGLYDVGAASEHYSWLSVISAALSLSLFIGYLRSEDVLISKVEHYQPVAVSG